MKFGATTLPSLALIGLLSSSPSFADVVTNTPDDESNTTIITDSMISQALVYLGSACNGMSGTYCNPFQLPLYDSAASFVPRMITKVEAHQCFIDPTQSTDYSNVMSFSEDAEDVEEQKASGFGISGSAPYKGIMFSLGLSHESLIQNMYSRDEKSYYSEISRKFVYFTATVNSTDIALSDDVTQAANDLPGNLDAEEDRTKWFDFFDSYGTHYVNSVVFGGSSKMYTFLESTVESDGEFDQSSFGFNLGAQFNSFAGIDTDFDDTNTEERYNQFKEFTFSQRYFSFGGEQSETNYEAWLKTVTDSPAPIITSIAPLSDLLGEDKPFDEAYAAYFEACPHSDDKGICNGYGSCNLQSGGATCECPEGTYMDEDDKLCYPSCQDDCNGESNGECQKGVCRCFVDENGFGFLGDSCAEKCGSATDATNDSSVWSVPGTNNEKTMDRCSSTACGIPGMDCWCRYYYPDDDDMHATNYNKKSCTNTTYKCDTKGKKCSVGWYEPWERCDCVDSVTCQWGQHDTCPKENILKKALKSIPKEETKLLTRDDAPVEKLRLRGS